MAFHPSRTTQASMSAAAWLALGVLAAACSREEPASDNMTVVETVDPMDAVSDDTNSMNDTLPGTMDTAPAPLPTESTNTMNETSSSGPSTTRPPSASPPPGR